MFKSTTLDGLGRKHQTDKSGSWGAAHDYLRKYEFFFRPLRREAFTFMELGVYKGASLKVWEEYFERAEIVGVDIEAETLAHAGGRVKVLLGDLSQTAFLQTLPALMPRVILDDASHWWADQLRALFVLYPQLMSGGLYIVEDLQTSFEPLGAMFSGGLPYRPFQVLSKIAEYMTGNDRPAPIMPDKNLRPIVPAEQFEAEIRLIADQTDAITFIERACVLVKK
ncbi:MAG: class I SAM-dependent methyltransferase [Candidatus Adiutrix sp.]|jgi:hypothetical protein|nr:class I SAM-dependent methyltransferase [Candidatus Adiutrix sp.]